MLLLDVLYVLEYSGEVPSGDVVTAPHLFDFSVFSENNQPLKSQFNSFDDRVPDSQESRQFGVLYMCEKRLRSTCFRIGAECTVSYNRY